MSLTNCWHSGFKQSSTTHHASQTYLPPTLSLCGAAHSLPHQDGAKAALGLRHPTQFTDGDNVFPS